MRLSPGVRLLLPMGCLLFLLTNPSAAGEAVLSRTEFFLERVFPTLFPALCLSGMVATSPWMARLYRLPFGIELTAWLLGVLCGFPVGARTAYLLYKRGQIDGRRAAFLCGFSNLASAPFLLGVVGNALFGDPAFGVLLVGLQAGCSLLTAGVLYFCLRPSCHGITTVPAKESGLLASVTAGTRTAGEVGGMLIFFGAAADCLGKSLSADGVPRVLLTALLEFSAGCGEAALWGGGGKLLAAITVGFSGLCVLGQVSAVTKGELSLAPYLGGKMIQAALMGTAVWLLV